MIEEAWSDFSDFFQNFLIHNVYLSLVRFNFATKIGFIARFFLKKGGGWEIIKLDLAEQSFCHRQRHPIYINWVYFE